jgi:hypothetical protein
MANENKKVSNLQVGLSSVGAVAGLYYAFSKKKGFWGYAGFFILGSLAGSLTAMAIQSFQKPSDNTITE